MICHGIKIISIPGCEQRKKPYNAIRYLQIMASGHVTNIGKDRCEWKVTVNLTCSQLLNACGNLHRPVQWTVHWNGKQVQNILIWSVYGLQVCRELHIQQTSFDMIEAPSYPLQLKEQVIRLVEYHYTSEKAQNQWITKLSVYQEYFKAIYFNTAGKTSVISHTISFDWILPP